jgi:hypothetical protein
MWQRLEGKDHFSGRQNGEMQAETLLVRSPTLLVLQAKDG